MELPKKDVKPNAKGSLQTAPELNFGTEIINTVPENSPSTRMILSKFPGSVENGEKLIDSFHCALSKGAFLYQGMLYVTTRCCYFYSPISFNRSSG